MGAKYTRDEVIQGRKCGLKKVDEAVAKVGMPAILEATVKISRQHPDAWGKGWPNVDWAFGNAWRHALFPDPHNAPEIAATENLDEALTPEDLQWLADQLGLDLKDYKPMWARRKPKKVRLPQETE